jgi:hypothetical protein
MYMFENKHRLTMELSTSNMGLEGGGGLVPRAVESPQQRPH